MKKFFKKAWAYIWPVAKKKAIEIAKTEAKKAVDVAKKKLDSK